MQGYITSFCNTFWISSDMICFSSLVTGILWQMFCAGSSAKRSFKPLLTMSMIKVSEVIDFHWERWLWMFPAVKHSTFCDKSEIGEWPTESVCIFSVYFASGTDFAQLNSDCRMSCSGESALSSRKQSSLKGRGLEVFWVFSKYFLISYHFSIILSL